MDLPQAGLLICKDRSCNSTITTELTALQAIGAVPLPVVGYVNTIYPFRCRTQSSDTCSGYLVRWYAADEGAFYKPTRSGESPMIRAVLKLPEPQRQQTCTDIKAYWASWSAGRAIGDFQGVLVFADGHFLTADPTSFPKRPSLANKGALKRVCTAICKKEWGRCE